MTARARQGHKDLTLPCRPAPVTPPDPAPAPRSDTPAPPPSPRPRKLSRRQAKKQVTITQLWSDAEGNPWKVLNVHRKDNQVRLQGPGGRPRFVSFGDLAKHYRLVEGS